jgi:hypothetical protein
VAVALLAVFGMQSRNLLVGAAAGSFLLLHGDAFELAHYFKEDPALLAGLALAFAAMPAYLYAPGPVPLTGLFIAAAVALSAKYVGVVMLFPALWLAWRRQGWRWALAGLGIFVLGAVLLNLRMLSHWSEAQASLARETALVANGAEAVHQQIPHAGFFQRFARRLMPPFGLFYAWGLWVWWRGRRTPTTSRPAETIMVLFPVVFTALLSFSAKDAGRYFHPCLLGLCYTAGLGLADVFLQLKSGAWLAAWPHARRQSLAWCVVGVALAGSIGRLWSVWDGFSHDARAELATFLRSSVPADAVVLQGQNVKLPDPKGSRELAAAGFPPIPQELRSIDGKKWIADLGGFAAMKASGVTHVAIAENEYRRYLEPDAKPKDALRVQFEQRRVFYEELFSKGHILFDRPAGKVGTHNPPLRLVALP